METPKSIARCDPLRKGVLMPSILRLSDQQISELIALTKPLLPHYRDVFLQLFALEFQGRSTIDDGECYRAARQIIRDNNLFEAPSNYDTGGTGRKRSA